MLITLLYHKKIIKKYFNYGLIPNTGGTINLLFSCTIGSSVDLQLQQDDKKIKDTNTKNFIQITS